MFSSISSFLPSALHINNTNSESRPAFNPVDTSDDEDDDKAGLNHGSHRNGQQDNHKQAESKPTAAFPTKKDKDKLANETFIFVRPPPSKSNHPLNLQVQLVPPSARTPSGVVPRVSMDSTSPVSIISTTTTMSNSSPLTRTPSGRSDVSYTAYSASTTSIASISSGTSNSPRRTIIPLYNLQAHNVMTNVIVDAGTDAKIAKFGKRGMELVDLMTIEPVEVWGDPNSATSPNGIGSTIPTGRDNKDGLSLLARKGSTMRGSATSSAVSLDSAGPSSHSSHPPPPPVSAPVKSSTLYDSQTPTPMPSSPSTSPVTPRRNIFGKLFKKTGGSSKSRDDLTGVRDVLPEEPLTTPESPTPTRPTGFKLPPAAKSSLFNKTLQAPRSNSGLRTTLRGSRDRLSAVLGMEDVRGRSVSPNPSAGSRNHSSVGSHREGEAQEEGKENGSVREEGSVRGSIDIEGGHHVSDLPLTQAEKQLQLQLRPPILGIQPSFVSAANPMCVVVAPSKAVVKSGSNANPPPTPHSVKEGPQPHERALMYVWLVRRWLKKLPAQLLHSPASQTFGSIGGLVARGQAAMNIGGNMVGGQGVEVRFEWKRAKGKGRKKRGRAREDGRTEKNVQDKLKDNRLSIASSATESETGHAAGTSTGTETERDVNGLGAPQGGADSKRRTSQGSGSGSSSKRKMSQRKHKRRESKTTSEDTSDEDSDPEDSETPWVCTLKIRRNGDEHTRAAPATGVVADPPVLRVKVGTLSPTPHHPKVVAMLKVPFPLPDIEVERMGVVKRKGLVVVQPGGVHVPEPPLSPPYNGTTLTAEEIKDVVCSTGLWLVVREGFGGVGRVSRKGDGWRIRA